MYRSTDLLRVLLGNFAGSVLGCVVILCIAPPGFPRSIYLLDLMVCFLGTAGVRVMVRMMAEATPNPRNGAVEKNTLIYGAGEAGVTLLREIQRNPKLPYRVRGFLDDWPDKKGARILGVPVHGGGDLVGALVAKYRHRHHSDRDPLGHGRADDPDSGALPRGGGGVQDHTGAGRSD